MVASAPGIRLLVDCDPGLAFDAIALAPLLCAATILSLSRAALARWASRSRPRGSDCAHAGFDQQSTIASVAVTVDPFADRVAGGKDVSPTPRVSRPIGVDAVRLPASRSDPGDLLRSCSAIAAMMRIVIIQLVGHRLVAAGELDFAALKYVRYELHYARELVQSRDDKRGLVGNHSATRWAIRHAAAIFRCRLAVRLPSVFRRLKTWRVIAGYHRRGSRTDQWTRSLRKA
jgi:hypothetical protein